MKKIKITQKNNIINIMIYNIILIKTLIRNLYIYSNILNFRRKILDFYYILLLKSANV